MEDIQIVALSNWALLMPVVFFKWLLYIIYIHYVNIKYAYLSLLY